MSLRPEQPTDDLEVFLAARETDPTAPIAADLPDPDIELAAVLLTIARTIEPEPRFAAELEARLRSEAAHLHPRHMAPQGGSASSAADRSRSRIPRAHLRTTLRRPLRHWQAWAAVAALLLCLLVAVPPVQAGLGTILRIGAVRIGWVPPTPVPHARPTPTPLPSVLDLAGATTLAHVREQAGFPITLPTYPSDLGPPDRVYLQQTDGYGPSGTMVVLVWLDPTHPDRVRLSLFELSDSVYFYKLAPQDVQHTTVNGQPAVWTTGPYYVQVRVGDSTATVQRTLIVAGHSLIWTDGRLTYRLETEMSLEGAVRTAESLR